VANFIFTGAKGRFIQQASLATGADAVLMILLKSSGLQVDTTLRDYLTLSTLLASNTEATFTNYARKVLTSGFTITQNFTTDIQSVAVTRPGSPPVVRRMTYWGSSSPRTGPRLGPLILRAYR
jgi:hypothetical protein